MRLGSKVIIIGYNNNKVGLLSAKICCQQPLGALQNVKRKKQLKYNIIRNTITRAAYSTTIALCNDKITRY